MFCGLILIHLAGITIFDPIFALGVVIGIINATYDLTIRSFSDLIDHSLAKEDNKHIEDIICDHASIYAGFTT